MNFTSQHNSNRQLKPPVRNRIYRIEPEGDNKFWAIDVRRLKDGKAFKNMDVTLGPAEQVEQNVHYDDSERLALHYEITVGAALRPPSQRRKSRPRFTLEKRPRRTTKSGAPRPLSLTIATTYRSPRMSLARGSATVLQQARISPWENGMPATFQRLSMPASL
ncbi:hypothetical protein LCGC14_1764370 [marine sediment metagenome]|uniref:Uncharacterized protein n=1 Tax=marine sediment metagenome TaxID=412755 RepID=A0A0F9JZU0_9ZZZZ